METITKRKKPKAKGEDGMGKWLGESGLFIGLT